MVGFNGYVYDDGYFSSVGALFLSGLVLRELLERWKYIYTLENYLEDFS